MTLIDTGFIWLAAILRQNKMGFLKNYFYRFLNNLAILGICAIKGNSSLFSSGLQIILLYCYTVEITDLILYGQKQFKDKLDKGLLMIILFL